MAKRSTSRTLLVVQLNPLRLVVIQETHDSPSSSSFPAAPVADKPGLARATQPTSAELFPWSRKAGGQ